jgi:hypothetical protein
MVFKEIYLFYFLHYYVLFGDVQSLDWELLGIDVDGLMRGTESQVALPAERMVPLSPVEGRFGY